MMSFDAFSSSKPYIIYNNKCKNIYFTIWYLKYEYITLTSQIMHSWMTYSMILGGFTSLSLNVTQITQASWTRSDYIECGNKFCCLVFQTLKTWRFFWHYSYLFSLLCEKTAFHFVFWHYRFFHYYVQKCAFHFML